MPFYEYECASCKFYTEVMQKISDAPLKKCPSCGKSALKKLVSAPVFRLKGGGWYETDFKSDKEGKRNLAGDANDGPAAKAADAPAAAAKATDSKAGDSKPEAKPVEKASAGDSSGTASRSASKSAGTKPAKPAAKPAGRPAARAPARKATPKPKAKASKRRGR
jgi:putative FmdB family regulatory protein